MSNIKLQANIPLALSTLMKARLAALRVSMPGIREYNDLSPQEKNEFQTIGVYRKADLPQWMADHGMIATPQVLEVQNRFKVPNLVRALIRLGLRHTDEEIVQMIRDEAASDSID